MTDAHASFSRDIRRAALQTMYQFDARGDDEPDVVLESLEGSAGQPNDHARGFKLARAAWADREAADAAVAELSPDWPTHRQPVVDRNILRLAHHEITARLTPPKVVINEAVELAREFSTERSPMFVNGVLDKLYRNWAATQPDITVEPIAVAPEPDACSESVNDA